MYIILFILLVVVIVNVAPDFPRQLGKNIARIKKGIIDGYKSEINKTDDKED